MQLTINKVDVSLVSKDGAVFANSLDIAKVFEKEHKNVLRIIDNMSERGKRNFEPTSYIDSFNRSQKMYEMNRDGFSFLVMGFTGEKADNFKLDFIDGFNKLENEVKRVQSQSTEIQLMKQMITTLEKTESRVTTLEQTKRLEAWQEKALQDAKNFKVYEIANMLQTEDKATISKLHRKIWSLLKKKYYLPRYSELQSIKFEEAREYILCLSFGDLI